ncbi:MAG: nucleotidyl transferase AbiEii/AbiGii toxin family protein [Deltaproteobacteria bacterium]|nr:nucleotidyl transferase AbiEii/AbiGii toxin family protein [Deltaproteobacteria bacterium]MBI3295287.1 nucleotidyl transferase AbiEii/AbiGii toxin family protein [Deltaproteobacteria bacterium]
MESPPKPKLALAAKMLPKPLLECIRAIFSQKIARTALVGGTALTGYYAGHRRSDDIDLFCADEQALRSAILGAKRLAKMGVEFSNETRSAQYYHANCLYRDHGFTLDVVLDENLFRVGAFETLPDRVVIPTLETLLRMKIATLVSRSAEKDLFDVLWLFENFGPLPIQQWISLGQSIDKGVNAETLLASLGGTKLRKEACDFAIPKSKSKDQIHSALTAFQKRLIQELMEYLKNQPTPPLGRLIKRLR